MSTVLSPPTMTDGRSGEWAVPTNGVPHDVLIVYREKRGRLDLFATPTTAMHAIIEWSDGTRMEEIAFSDLFPRLASAPLSLL